MDCAAALHDCALRFQKYIEQYPDFRQECLQFSKKSHNKQGRGCIFLKFSSIEDFNLFHITGKIQSGSRQYIQRNHPCLFSIKEASLALSNYNPEREFVILFEVYGKKRDTNSLKQVFLFQEKTETTNKEDSATRVSIGDKKKEPRVTITYPDEDSDLRGGKPSRERYIESLVKDLYSKGFNTIPPELERSFDSFVQYNKKILAEVNCPDGTCMMIRAVPTID